MTTYSTGGAVTIGGGYLVDTKHYFLATVKGPNMPASIESVPCPLCTSPSVRNCDGSDYILVMATDHKPPKQSSVVVHCGPAPTWEPSGVVLRVRICSVCGHLYATRSVPPCESVCHPGK